MTRFMELIHHENKQLLDLALIGALFGVIAGSSGGLVFGLMTGRSWQTDLVLTVAAALVAGTAVFVLVYLQLIARRDS